jgi:hypothetical protein
MAGLVHRADVWAPNPKAVVTNPPRPNHPIVPCSDAVSDQVPVTFTDVTAIAILLSRVIFMLALGDGLQQGGWVPALGASQSEPVTLHDSDNPRPPSFWI